MAPEPFHQLDVEKWNDLKDAFKLNWPRGITGYYALDYLERWLKLGQDYGFRVLNPFGDAKSGMVVVIKDEKEFIEMLIECPQEDTSKLAEALKCTKLIDWNKYIIVLFAQKHVIDCVEKITRDIGINILGYTKLLLYILKKESPLYDVSLPKGFVFKQLTEEHIELAHSTWPHRDLYPGETKYSRYFQLLIGSKSGFGLFKEGQLVSFGFIKEMGALGHLYTLEEHRRKGYGELITKLISNEILKQGKDVFSFCVDENIQSCKMHEKLGFKLTEETSALEIQRSI